MAQVARAQQAVELPPMHANSATAIGCGEVRNSSGVGIHIRAIYQENESPSQEANAIGRRHSWLCERGQRHAGASIVEQMG